MNMTSAAFRTRIGLRGAFYDDAKLTASLVELYAKYQRIPGTGYAFMRTAERFVPSDMDSVRREFGKLQIPVVNILGSMTGSSHGQPQRDWANYYPGVV